MQRIHNHRSYQFHNSRPHCISESLLVVPRMLCRHWMALDCRIGGRASWRQSHTWRYMKSSQTMRPSCRQLRRRSDSWFCDMLILKPFIKVPGILTQPFPIQNVPAPQNWRVETEQETNPSHILQIPSVSVGEGKLRFLLGWWNGCMIRVSWVGWGNYVSSVSGMCLGNTR